MKALVLDANILIRAVLGTRVRSLITTYASTVQFFTPDVAYADARKYLPALLQKRNISPAHGLTVLNHLEPLVLSVELHTYSPLKEDAMNRIAMRDADDWPVLASAILIDCPVWTEDTDFFGTGVPVWTTDRVELYLA